MIKGLPSIRGDEAHTGYMDAMPMKGNRFLLYCIGYSDEEGISGAGLDGGPGEQIYMRRVVRVNIIQGAWTRKMDEKDSFKSAPLIK